MKIWPWQKEEVRQQDYSDAVIQHILASAQGTVTEGATAGIETVAGWWQRAFSSAEVQPAGVVGDLLSPHLGRIGRGLCKAGEVVFEIATEGGLSLIPASTWTVMGNPNPASWMYTLTLPAPSAVLTRELPADRVLHLMYTPSKNSPWIGESPISNSKTTLELLSNMEKRLAEEVNQAVGAVIPVPNIEQAGGLLASLRNLAGRLELVESTNQGWGTGQQGIPTGDFAPRRLGGTPPETTVDLRRQTEQSILSAAGVPVTVLGGSTDAASREGLRQFLHVTIEPVARDVARVLSQKFGQDLSFNFDKLFATDLQARARSFGSMTSGGMDVGTAADKAGLSE